MIIAHIWALKGSAKTPAAKQTLSRWEDRGCQSDLSFDFVECA
jgi:hypothetical protein